MKIKTFLGPEMYSYISFAVDVCDACKSNPFQGPLEGVGPRNGRALKSLDFQGAPLPMALKMDGGGAVRSVLTLYRSRPPPPPASGTKLQSHDTI
jgi:hypothetical protein